MDVNLTLPPDARQRYADVRPLARGGMGDVCLATDTRLDRTVALKSIRSDLSGERETQRRLRRELKALGRIVHPNVVRLLDFHMGGPSPILVLEYVEGKTLEELMLRNELTVLEFVPLVAQVCSGLDAVHEAGVLHRDIKPANIMVCHDGTARLMDFGMAAFHDGTYVTRLTETGAVSGTVCYLSPEVLQGRTADARSDVYQLGIVLYEGLTGQLPFTSEDLFDGLARGERAVTFRSVNEVRPELSLRLSCLVMRATAVSPDERIASAAELGRQLCQWLEDPDCPSRVMTRCCSWRHDEAARAVLSTPIPSASRRLPAVTLLLLMLLLVGAGLFHPRVTAVPTSVSDARVVLDGDAAIVTYRTSRPVETKLCFSDEGVNVGVIGPTGATWAHQAVASPVEEGRRYAFRVMFGDDETSLPLMFSTRAPISNLTVATGEAGRLVIGWKSLVQATARARYLGGKEGWTSLRVEPGTGVDEYRMCVPANPLPATLLLSCVEESNPVVEHIVHLGFGRLLRRTLRASRPYRTTANLFAHGPSSLAKWQSGALPPPEDFDGLLALLSAGSDGAHRFLASTTAPVAEQARLYGELALCRMLSLWAPDGVSRRLEALDPLLARFCRVETVDRPRYERLCTGALPVCEYENPAFLAPTNYAVGSEATRWANRVKRHYPASTCTVNLRFTFTTPSGLGDRLLVLLEVLRCGAGSMLRLTLNDRLPIVVFSKTTGPGASHPGRHKRRPVPEYIVVDVPRSALAPGENTLFIESFLRYRLARTPALSSLYVATR